MQKKKQSHWLYGNPVFRKYFLKRVAICLGIWAVGILKFLVTSNRFSYPPSLGLEGIIIAIILVAVGSIIFAQFLVALWCYKSEWEMSAGGGNGGPIHPIIVVIFLFAISVLIYLILIKIYGVNDFSDKATVWSAVYGTVIGTFGIVRRNI